MAAPTVTSCTPATGDTGTAVAIVGTNFTAATAVKFGTASAEYSVISATSIVAVTPSYPTGAATVTVTNADGTSANAVTFTYSGDVLFTVAEARLFDKIQLNSATTYPSGTISAKEVVIRADFESIIGVALVPTTSTEYYDGDGSRELYLSHHNPFSEATPRAVTVTSITVIATDDTETAFTSAELSDVVKYPHKLYRRSGTFTYGRRNIKVVYTHGYTAAPDNIKGAALQVLLMSPPDGIVPSSIPSSAIGGMDGTINWARIKDPDRGRWYGHEIVDGVLRRHRAIETPLGIA
jgi:hypothetical protein